MVNNTPITKNLQEENIYISLEKTLKTNETTTLSLEYSIKIPDAKFTGYGAENDSYLLKNFSWYQIVLMKTMLPTSIL